MMATIWYIYKPGEERTFASPILPTTSWRQHLKEQGYRILEVNFNVPVAFEELSDESTLGNGSLIDS